MKKKDNYKNIVMNIRKSINSFDYDFDDASNLVLKIIDDVYPMKKSYMANKIKRELSTEEF